MSVNTNNNSKNVPYYNFGSGSFKRLRDLFPATEGPVVFIVDHFFTKSDVLKGLPVSQGDVVELIDTTHEPKTDGIDALMSVLHSKLNGVYPKAIVGLGGGSALDTAKAVSNLFNNPGRAEEYQGWDLVKNPGVYKIGIPTISGTGAESSRTCVMTNSKSGIKLGMNSDFTVYDQLILDPDLTGTVARDQYFYTGMDTYIHCIESLSGSHRNAIGDAFSREALQLCRSVFQAEDMRSFENRENLMVASYLGGVAIANSYVGVIHPFSAGLSVVLGTHHCVANCIVMGAMEEFYPNAYKEFKEFQKKQGVTIPSGIARNLSDAQYEGLYNSTVVHERPLKNALGDNFKQILTFEKVKDLFKKM